jgi:adenylate cyclase class 2
MTLEGVGTFLELERMVPDDMPAEAIQAELAAFVASFGVTAIRTDETYDSFVRAAQVVSEAQHEHLATPIASTAVTVLSRPPATES